MHLRKCRDVSSPTGQSLDELSAPSPPPPGSAELLVILDAGMGSLSDEGVGVAPCPLKEHGASLWAPSPGSLGLGINRLLSPWLSPSGEASAFSMKD